MTHCVPMDDYRPHSLAGMSCWCRPIVDADTIVHHALDRREAYEDGYLRIH